MPDRDSVLIDSFESQKESHSTSEEMRNMFRNFGAIAKESKIQLLVVDYETQKLKPLGI